MVWYKERTARRHPHGRPDTYRRTDQRPEDTETETERTQAAVIPAAGVETRTDAGAEEYIYVDRTLYEGRPEDLSGRAVRETRTYDLLDRLGIRYRRVDHGPAMTIAACKEVDDVLGAPMCKNLFLTNAQRTAFYLLLMPGDKPFKTKLLSKQIGSARLSFAEGEYMERFLDIHPGSVSVMGLMNDTEHRVHLLVDRDVAGAPFLCCHPCENTSSLKIETKDIFNIFLPAVGHEPTVVDL